MNRSPSFARRLEATCRRFAASPTGFEETRDAGRADFARLAAEAFFVEEGFFEAALFVAAALFAVEVFLTAEDFFAAAFFTVGFAFAAGFFAADFAFAAGFFAAGFFPGVAVRFAAGFLIASDIYGIAPMVCVSINRSVARICASHNVIIVEMCGRRARFLLIPLGKINDIM